mgnify:CR=1 FL=1
MDVLSRQLTPFLLTIFLVLLSAIPFQVPGLARVMPLFSLIVIFPWGVYRAELLPAYAVLVIGFFQDALSGVPMGVYTLVYVLVYGLVSFQHRFFSGKSFCVVWLGYAVVSAGASFLVWLLVSLLHGAVVDPLAVAFQYLLGLGCYPLIAHLFLRWQRAVLQQV